MSSTVGEVAREAGVSPHTVRFYEQHGLIAAERTPGNQRRFDTGTACRIKVARVAQRIGLTIAEVRGLLDTLPPAPTPGDWQQLEHALAAEAERRIGELRAVLADIRSDQKLCAV
jgi:MerR family transcriptional regulator, redox-sensitive transcriptional activator SoxR